MTPLFAFDKTRLWQVPSTMSGKASVGDGISDVSSLILASYFPQGSVLPAPATVMPYLYWDAGVTTVVTSGSSTTVTSNYWHS